MATPTLAQIAEASGGQIARDGESVIVGYGPAGYLRLTPDSIIRDGQELPAVAIHGRLTRRDGGAQADLRRTLRAAGLEIR